MLICICFPVHKQHNLFKLSSLAVLIHFWYSYTNFLQTFYKQCVEEEGRNLPKVITTTLAPSNVTTNGTTIAHTAVSTSIIASNCVMPLSHVADDVLHTLWKIVYWTSQFLTWYSIIIKLYYS